MKSTSFLLFLIICVIPFQGVSQVRKFYYDPYWQLSRNDSTAVYYRLSSFDTTNLAFSGQVEDFTMAGVPIMKGTYKSGIKEGEFTTFFGNSTIESVGNFSANERSGVWKYFYKNGKPKSEIVFGKEPLVLFLNDSLGNKLLENGIGKWFEEFEEFRFSNKVTIEGQYDAGLRTGDWICKLDGKMFYKETFEKGKFISGYRYDGSTSYNEEFKNKLQLPYKFGVTEALKAKDNVSREDYPFIKSLPSSPNVTYVMVENQPEFPGGYEAMNNFIEKNLHHPKNTKKKKITGKVFVSFIIQPDGAISDVQVAKGLGVEYDMEAMRVIASFPNWKPGKQNGRPVPVKFLLPVTFR